jgi:hypothetical protein
VKNEEMREFLTSRRARVTPDQAGLPAYGSSRRVQGVRWEVVAILAGVSVEYHTRLERGKAAGVSERDLAEHTHLADLLIDPPTYTGTARTSSSSAGP